MDHFVYITNLQQFLCIKPNIATYYSRYIYRAIKKYEKYIFKTVRYYMVLLPVGIIVGLDKINVFQMKVLIYSKIIIFPSQFRTFYNAVDVSQYLI